MNSGSHWMLRHPLLPDTCEITDGDGRCQGEVVGWATDRSRRAPESRLVCGHHKRLIEASKMCRTCGERPAFQFNRCEKCGGNSVMLEDAVPARRAA